MWQRSKANFQEWAANSKMLHRLAAGWEGIRHSGEETRRFAVWGRDYLLSLLPGTWRFRRRVQHFLLKTTNKYIQTFSNLKTVDRQEKLLIKHKMRHYAHEQAKLEVLGYFILMLFLAPVFWTILLLPFLVIYTVARWLDQMTALPDEYFIYAGAGFFLAMVIVKGKLLDISRTLARYFLGVGAWDFLILCFLSIFIVIDFNRLSTGLAVKPVNGMALGIGALILVLDSLLVFIHLFERATNWFDIGVVNYSGPSAIIAYRLVFTIDLIESEASQWSNFAFKSRLMAWLEIIARRIETYVPRRMRSGDLATDRWIQADMKKIAAEFRYYKLWVASPYPDTRQELLKQLSRSLALAASDNWAALPRREADQTAARSLWLWRAANFARFIVSAGLPGLIFYAIQQTQFAIQPPIADYLTVGAVIWAILAMISVIDPDYNQKLSSLKTIGDFFSPTK